ncbi:hypothetical protein Ae201684P_011336 [Aphanomyces euteiches]|nr:hypothetical protein Ae201684P_011336 [Aphanomyces euteiches]
MERSIHSQLEVIPAPLCFASLWIDNQEAITLCTTTDTSSPYGPQLIESSSSLSRSFRKFFDHGVASTVGAWRPKSVANTRQSKGNQRPNKERSIRVMNWTGAVIEHVRCDLYYK